MPVGSIAARSFPGSTCPRSASTSDKKTRLHGRGSVPSALGYLANLPYVAAQRAASSEQRADLATGSEQEDFLMRRFNRSGTPTNVSPLAERGEPVPWV